MAIGYSALVRWAKVLLPAGAVVTVVAIFLAGRSGDTGESLLSARDLATLGAGLRLEAPRFSGQTPAGEPYSVRADWASPDGPNPGRVTLHRPEGQIETRDGRRLTGEAKEGLFLREADRLVLTGRVRLESRDGYAFAGPRLDIDLAGRTARSSEPVRLTGPEGSLEAGAMRIDQGRPGAGAARIFFDEGVRVVFIPREAR